jgi:hypothetical protein
MFFASFLRAVCRKSRISTIWRGLVGARATGGSDAGRRGRGVGSEREEKGRPGGFGQDKKTPVETSPQSQIAIPTKAAKRDSHFIGALRVLRLQMRLET